jgi:hypothetical protein
MRNKYLPSSNNACRPFQHTFPISDGTRMTDATVARLYWTVEAFNLSRRFVLYVLVTHTSVTTHGRKERPSIQAQEVNV